MTTSDIFGLSRERSENVEIFSKRLQELRKERKWNQEEVAEQCSLILRTYRRYEKGESEPQLSVLVKIADLYDVSMDYLAGRTDDPGWMKGKMEALEVDSGNPQ